MTVGSHWAARYEMVIIIIIIISQVRDGDVREATCDRFSGDAAVVGAFDPRLQHVPGPWSFHHRPGYIPPLPHAAS